MKIKDIKIEVPEGYEIDKENSTFEHIKFKPIKKALTYDDVARKLFENELAWFIDKRGSIMSTALLTSEYTEPTNCTSHKQAEKLLAINKLMNVAKYLNGDWRPNFWNLNQRKYILYICGNDIKIGETIVTYSDIAFFKSKELAKQAIDILGEETIKTALNTDI